MEAPAYLAANLDSCYTFRVRVENMPTVDNAYVTFTAPDSSHRDGFALWDDGGARTISAPPFACSPSGDIVPNDGILTGRLDARTMANGVVGTWRCWILAGDVSDTRTMEIQNVESCLITQWPQTQNFATCFDPETVEVRVLRSDADFVDTVRMYTESVDFPNTNTQQDFAPVSGDTIWQTILTPRFFECIGAGSYSLTYSARTRFGMVCTQQITPLTYTNDLPVLSNSTLPDTAYRPSVDSTLIVATVNLQDCELQGATDFFGYLDAPGVKFDVYRDPNPWGHDGDFFLRDDGGAPDQHAGDGTYSSWLVIKPDSTLTNNMYYFRFYAVECAAPFDTSAFLLDSVRIIQSPSPMLSSRGPQPEAGSHFAVLN